MPPAAPRPPWGWILSARVLLSLVAIVGSLRLLGVAAVRDCPAERMPPLVVDVNTAPPEVLHALPRLGPVLVRRIVAAREEAPFRSLDDLDARVRGIGPATIAALRPFLRVGPDIPSARHSSAPLVAQTGSSAP
jgi:competence protein ComEA